MFAIIKHKNNQYKVEKDKEYEIALTLPEDEKSDKIVFDQVLLIGGDKTVIGQPLVEGAKVEAEIVGNTRGEKVTGIKFKAKKRYKRTLGHKQDYTKIKVLDIKTK